MGSGNKIHYPVEQLRQWAKEGRTQPWIAKELGIDRRLVHKVLKKHGIVCQHGYCKADSHPCWRGGRQLDQDGYVLVFAPWHPAARRPRRRYVTEHRLVMEGHLKRFLRPGEVVHHVNGNKQDNRLENLQLFDSNAEHLRHELTGKCPRWSEAGRRALLQGAALGRANHKALRERATLNKQKTARCPA